MVEAAGAVNLTCLISLLQGWAARADDKTMGRELESPTLSTPAAH